MKIFNNYCNFKFGRFWGRYHGIVSRGQKEAQNLLFKVFRAGKIQKIRKFSWEVKEFPKISNWENVHFFFIGSWQGSNGIDSFWFANFYSPKWIKKHKKILIREVIRNPANHDSSANQNRIESKIKGRWIVIHSFANHFLIRFRIENESSWFEPWFWSESTPKSRSKYYNDSIFSGTFWKIINGILP